MIEAVAIFTSMLLVVLAIFQILLALGIPLGKFAWGGQHKVLPTRLRIASAFSIILYLFFALIILNQSGIINLFNKAGWTHTATLILCIYFFIGVVMNAISRSKPERLTMTPIALTIALSFLYVYLNS